MGLDTWSDLQYQQANPTPAPTNNTPTAPTYESTHGWIQPQPSIPPPVANPDYAAWAATVPGSINYSPPTAESTNPYAGWTQNQWAMGLENKPGNPNAVNAAQLEYAIGKGWINPQQAQAAQVQKDAWMTAAGRYNNGSYNSAYGGAAGGLPYTDPTTGQTTYINPWQLQPINQDWGSPVRNFNIQDSNWGALPSQYRDPTAAWIKQAGFQPDRSSLGQFNFKSWQAPVATQINPTAFDNIPDTNFAAWAKALFGFAPAPAQ